MFRVGEQGVLRVSEWERYPWLVHGFSTRATGDFLDLPADSDIAAAFGAAGFGTATPKQVHSGSFIRTDGPWAGERPEGDAVITSQSGVLVGVRTADCVPVLLVDPLTRSVAAIHAGWRGIVAGVLPNAIAGLIAEYGARPRDIEAAIGPGIRSCCFEVGEEVACQFGEESVDRGRARPHVDLASALREQLARVGVEKAIECDHCTSCDLSRYFSHRAERGVTGRMLAVAGMLPQMCQ